MPRKAHGIAEDRMHFGKLTQVGEYAAYVYHSRPFAFFHGQGRALAFCQGGVEVELK